MLNKVLCIDDSKLIQDATKRMVRRASFARNVDAVYNGREALDYLMSLKPADFPELILLDIEMPDMDGWEFLETLQNLSVAGSSRMKIIIVSSVADIDNRVRAIQGPLVQAFISKPLTFRKLEKLKRRYNMEML